MADLAGFRLLVVGASSGIGRAVGLQGAAAGAVVAFAARRTDRLATAVSSAATPCLTLTCDVRDDDQCAATVAEAADRLGGLDGVVYAAASCPLTRFEEADGDLWRSAMETNVVGAALVARAALPHLRATAGRLVLLGSSSVGRPYPGLVPYEASKAALHELAHGLRNEHPWLSVTMFVVGPTLSELADAWDPDLAVAMFNRWNTEGYVADRYMEVEAVADQVLGVLGSGTRVDEIRVMPDPPVEQGD